MKNKKNIIIAVLLIMACMISSLQSADAAGYKSAYKNKISAIENDNPMHSITHKTIKVRGSKIPLLAISDRMTSDLDFVTFYVYSNGKLKELATDNRSGGSVKKYKNYILVSSGHDSLECCATLYKYSKGKLKKIKSYAEYDNEFTEEWTLVEQLEKKVCKKTKVKYKRFKKIGI